MSKVHVNPKKVLSFLGKPRRIPVLMEEQKAK
jgi:hypothetical protein